MWSSFWKRLISPQASRLWGLPFIITIMLVLFNLLGPGFATAHKQAVQAASIAQPVPGQLFCPKGYPTCERVLTDQISYNSNGTSVTVMRTQEWQANYQLAYPIASRVGPLGVHHALGNSTIYNSVCQANSQSCTDDLDKDAQTVKSTLNSMYACAGQPAPFATTALPESSSALPLAYHVSTQTRVLLLFLAYLVVEFVSGTSFTAIQIFPLKAGPLATSILGGIQYGVSSIAFTVTIVLLYNAARANNGNGPYEIFVGWITALMLWLKGAPPNILPRVNAQCFATAQTKVVQRLCPYPFPPAYAKAEAQMCYPGEQLFPN